MLLLLFYISPSFLKYGLLTEAVGNELLLILAPALIFAHLAGWRWIDTFNLHKSPARIMLAAALFGIGLPPWASLFQEWQNKIWPADPDSMKMQLDMFTEALRTHAALKVVLIGALAGVCEEMLFRGPLQMSMLRKAPAWAAIVFTALLFSAIHLDVHGFPLRAVLGAMLGFIACRSGSIFPAILAHALYDITALGIAAWQIHHVPLNPIGEGTMTSLDKWALILGAGLMLAAVAIGWRRSEPQALAPGQLTRR